MTKHLHNPSELNFSKLDFSTMDMSIFPPSLLGRLDFQFTKPTKEPLPPGKHPLGIAQERDTYLYVPQDLPKDKDIPFLVMFHGASGSMEKVQDFFIPLAEKHKFLLMIPQSMFITWDLSIAGNGPDLERLQRALKIVFDHFPIAKNRLGFAGFSDGASYSLTIGITNGDIVSHVIAFSGGYMNVYTPNGKPPVFIAHSPEDEQLPIKTSGLQHVEKLREGGYDVEFLEFHGPHKLQQPVVDKGIEFFLTKNVER